MTGNVMADEYRTQNSVPVVSAGADGDRGRDVRLADTAILESFSNLTAPPTSARSAPRVGSVGHGEAVMNAQRSSNMSGWPYSVLFGPTVQASNARNAVMTDRGAVL